MYNIVKNIENNIQKIIYKITILYLHMYVMKN